MITLNAGDVPGNNFFEKSLDKYETGAYNVDNFINQKQRREQVAAGERYRKQPVDERRT